MSFAKLCKDLESKIIKSYEEGVSLEDAERLAAEFLYGQMAVSGELKKADLDSRMRKSGVKAVRAAIYLDEVKKGDKKPTEAQLTAILDSHEVVALEQQSFDTAEASRDELERLHNTFRDAHIHYRGVAKGKFE